MITIKNGEVIETQDGDSLDAWMKATRDAQENRSVCSFIDINGVYDIGMFVDHGIDISRVLYSNPDNDEQARDVIEALARSGQIDLLLVVGAPMSRLYNRLPKVKEKLVSFSEQTKTTLVFVDDHSSTST